MARWLRWHCPPDTGFEVGALAVWGSLSGKPKSNELQLSRLEVTKEWTSCSVACGVRNLTIFPIMWIWWPHDWHSVLTCCSILRWESNITPGFFSWGLVETVESPTFIVDMLSFLRKICLLLLCYTNSHKSWKNIKMTFCYSGPGPGGTEPEVCWMPV